VWLFTTEADSLRKSGVRALGSVALHPAAQRETPIFPPLGDLVSLSLGGLGDFWEPSKTVRVLRD
jgi:hypothetical protein